jgi:hypothetical protein
LVAPLLVAYGYPALRLGPGCGQRREDIGIGHFNAISSVEALDVRVLRRTTGLDEIPGDVVVFRPRLQDMASEFRAIAPRGQASRSLRIDVDFLLPAIRVIRSLDQIIEWRGKPTAIRCDNGPEYISGALQQWADQNDIRLDYIQPGNPQQNAYIERYNRTVRYDWLAQHLFDSIEQVQLSATRWLWIYNHERPNMAIGGITPMQKLAMAA